ncbi:MAG TPA: hypothetical protein VF334_14130 [Polyangia bacterium]
MVERMKKKDPLAFIAEHGLVMQSAEHALVPSLASYIAGEPIRGSWWAHEKGRDIFRALVAVYESRDVVACKLVDGKLTLIHRRLWPALATLAQHERQDRACLTKVTQEHTDAGHHENREVPFPAWLPRGMALPSVELALSRLGARTAALPLRPTDAAPRSPPSAGRAARARRR